MVTGKVKWFKDSTGYGFITPDEGGKDVFVHHSVIEGTGYRTLKDGQKVQYEFEERPKGPVATAVRPLPQ